MCVFFSFPFCALHLIDSKFVAQYGATPLYLSAHNGHARVCVLLLEKGANVEAADKVYMYSLGLH